MELTYSYYLGIVPQLTVYLQLAVTHLFLLKNREKNGAWLCKLGSNHLAMIPVTFVVGTSSSGSQ